MQVEWLGLVLDSGNKNAKVDGEEMAESKAGEKDNGKVISRLPMWLRGLQRAWCGILAGACSCTRCLDDVTGLREIGCLSASVPRRFAYPWPDNPNAEHG